MRKEGKDLHQFTMTSKAVPAYLLALVIVSLCQSVLGFPRFPDVQSNFIFSKNFNKTNRAPFGRTRKNLGFFYTDDTEERLVVPERIVGGTYATEGQFPFMAVVHRLIKRGLVAQCGGTILSKRWVLTAGHCIVKQPRRFFVVLGVTNKSGIAYDFKVGPGVAMHVNKGAVHPQYGLGANDIGLLYMPEDIPFDDNIQPIRLAGRSWVRESLAKRNAYVIGWGKDSQNGKSTKDLKYAILPIISNYQCSRFWNVNKRNICTAPGLGEDACQGDSGGPLAVMEDGEYLQVGIVSYGDANCPSQRPGVFTRVPNYAQWIEEVTGLNY